MPSFIHLRCHSEYSLVDGIVCIKPLMQQLKAQRMPAVALTDQSQLFAAVKYFKAAMAEGIKPIFGADLYLEDPDKPSQPLLITVLCQNDRGYHHLLTLISESYLHGQHHGMAVIKWEDLQAKAEGLLVLYRPLDERAMENTLPFWQQHFPDCFYLDIQRLGKPGEAALNNVMVAFAQKHNLPLVATNDVRFLTPDDYEAHEVRVCIHQGELLENPKRSRHYTQAQYLKSAEEMQVLFADIPEALANTVEIAKRCNVCLTLGKTCLPKFPTPSPMTEDAFLAQEAREGLQARLAKTHPHLSPQDQQAYEDRLALELDVICRMGFAGYFLIVADFIRWSRANRIPVGPGRGSGAGSLVAYVLGITNLDPLVHELLFERFLNPERVSMPDFDIDFCMEGRDRVIEYVAEKYGRASVSQIITFGTMAAKAVVRDVGRVMGFSYGYVDKIAKLIPFEVGMTLEKALHDEALLLERYQQEEETRQLIDMAKKLEGIARNAGKHAGGVVIAPSALSDFTPIYCEPDSQQIVSQFDKDDVEAIGLVKFDFLGLRTLTIIQWALDIIGTPIDIDNIPTDDKATFDLLKSCQTQAVFQLESRGMRDLIKRLQPDTFEEIVALVALFRPGPLQSGMVDDFIDRKHGRAEVTYPHPALEPILKPTYGVILYQEQVMQIAQVLAGYTLGGADILRRAMGKKKPEEMAEQRAIFLAGALEKNIRADVANYIFDLMEKFAGYGFNRSHSAAYALIAYQTAWLKTHYPAAFMAAVLSSDMDNTDKVVLMVNECRALKLPLDLPSIDCSQYAFTLNQDQHIVYGLGAIKGVGQAAAESIIEERTRHGRFEHLFAFCRRVDTSKINRRVIEALIKAGAMDQFEQPRGVLLASVDNAMAAAEKYKRDQLNKQSDMFASFLPQTVMDIYEPLPPGWNERVQLEAEKSVLGWYAYGHPMIHYQAELRYIAPTNIRAVDIKSSIRLAGIVSQLRVMNTKRGDRIAFMTLDDGDAVIEVAVFADVFSEYREIILKDHLLVVEGEVSIDEHNGGYRLRAERLYTMEQAREHLARGILLHLSASGTTPEGIQALAALLAPYQGGTCPVHLHYADGTSTVKLTLGSAWKVFPKDVLIEALRGKYGQDAVKMGYGERG